MMIPLLVWEKVGYYVFHEKYLRLMKELKELCHRSSNGSVKTFACFPNYVTFSDRILGDRALQNLSCGVFFSSKPLSPNAVRLHILGPNIKCKKGLLFNLSNWLKGYGRKPPYVMDCRMKYKCVEKRLINVCDKEIVIVGHLPDRYIYSSGMLSPYGYKDMLKLDNYYYYT